MNDSERRDLSDLLAYLERHSSPPFPNARAAACVRAALSDGWLHPSIAPRGRKLLVWGAAGLAFMMCDDMGQWRNMVGRPKDAPLAWMEGPGAPR